MLTSLEIAESHGVKPLVYLKSFGVAGADPTLTCPAVPAAVNRALKRAGLAIDAMDLIEIQEAFAAQTLAQAGMKELSYSILQPKELRNEKASGRNTGG